MSDTRTSGKNTFFSRPVSAKECTDTGMAMVLVCLIVERLTGRQEWLIAAIVLLVVNMTLPTAYTLAARLWLGFSHALGAVMSRVILTLVFLCVVTPLAVLRRAFGHDPMLAKKWKAGTESVFATRDHTYTPEEIERPY